MFQVLAPPADLRPFVRFLWAVHAPAAGPERVIPDGCCELILHFGARPRRVSDAAAGPLQPEAFVFGQIERALVLDAHGELDVFGVRFTPVGVAALWGFDARDLGPREHAIDEMFPSSRSLQLERLHEAATFRARYDGVVGWLRATARRTPRRSVRRASAALAGVEQSQADPSSVARALGVSRRSLERDFQAAVGLSPAAYMRLRRIDACARTLRRQNAALAAIAFDAGYADQPHFTREFRSVVGLSPGAYRAQLGLAPSALAD